MNNAGKFLHSRFERCRALSNGVMQSFIPHLPKTSGSPPPDRLCASDHRIFSCRVPSRSEMNPCRTAKGRRKKNRIPNNSEECGKFSMVGETGFESDLEPQCVCDNELPGHDKQGQIPSYPPVSDDVARVGSNFFPTDTSMSSTVQNQSELPIYVQHKRLHVIAASPELAELVDEWRGIPDHVRATILLLVRSSR